MLRAVRRYIKFHIQAFFDLYSEVLLRSDKRLFALLFNLRSFLTSTSTRIRWKEEAFLICDNEISGFQYKIRHQRQCNMAYQRGVRQRADLLAHQYFLNQINFKDGDVFLDCGANVGDLKIWFELNGIDIEYVGFEPSPVEYSLLRENVSPSVVHNVGLWNTDGELVFYVSSQGADSSLVEPGNYDRKIVTRVSRLENYIHQPIKCVKLEAEGAEPEIISGLGNKTEMIEYIAADLGPERGRERASTLVPVTNQLFEMGFELIDIRHKRVCALYRNKNFNLG